MRRLMRDSKPPHVGCWRLHLGQACTMGLLRGTPGISTGHHLQSLSKVGAADMREMPTKPRRRGANHDALMVSAPRFAKESQMSEDAKTLMYWINGWRDTAIADYGNEYEFWCARAWASHIIGFGC